MSAKRTSELKHAQVFANWLKKTYGLEHRIELNQDINSDIDVFLMLKRGKGLETLNLQIKTPDQEPIQQGVKFKRTGELESIDYDPTAWISEVIRSAEDYYPKDQRQKLIFLAAAHIPPLPGNINSERLVVSCSHSQFKGIYYTVLPHTIDGEISHPGVCLEIKDAFKNMSR